jgi:hypothetical protein
MQSEEADCFFMQDLDYTYSRTGDVPRYLHSLAFPPSYFHRVIRTGTGNPVVHVDLAPWAGEICASVRLMQDRIRAEGRRTVVRWVHRARFHIRGSPGAGAGSSPGPSEMGMRIPGTELEVDKGWYGAVVVEAEGTNEGLAELRARCGAEMHPRYGAADWEERRVFRILRERR